MHNFFNLETDLKMRPVLQRFTTTNIIIKFMNNYINVDYFVTVVCLHLNFHTTWNFTCSNLSTLRWSNSRFPCFLGFSWPLSNLQWNGMGEFWKNVSIVLWRIGVIFDKADLLRGWSHVQIRLSIGRFQVEQYSLEINRGRNYS